MGEGGSIGAPATILSAVNDALRGFGARFQHLPVTPAQLLEVIDAAPPAPTQETT
jgi:carbon-monoxide dehydrogenase large subunit